MKNSIITPWGIISNIGFFHQEKTTKTPLKKNVNSPEVFETISIKNGEESRKDEFQSLYDLQRSRGLYNGCIVYLNSSNEKYRGYWIYDSEVKNEFGEAGLWKMIKKGDKVSY